MKTVISSLLTTLLIVANCLAVVYDHVVPVAHSNLHLSLLPQVREVHGSGVCIDENCSVVATAYHLQLLAGKGTLSVGVEHTAKVLTLTEENDANISDIRAGKALVSYNVATDIAFVYTKNPIRHKSGAPYSYKAFVGQPVTIAGYSKHKYETREAHIIGSNVPLIIGHAQVNENLVLDAFVDPGMAGSGVFDERGNLLGMVVLTGSIKSRTGDVRSCVAIPVANIARALVKLDQPLGSMAFNDIPVAEPPLAPKQYVLFQEGDLPNDTSDVIPTLSAVPGDLPNAVEVLRAKAGIASELMVNIIATQCMRQGTQASICHEVSVIEGQQRFRKISRDGTTGDSLRFFPRQNHGVWAQSDWTEAMGEIADNPWVFQGAVGDLYLFNFKSAVADDRCSFDEYSQGVPLFGGGHAQFNGAVDCFEQILTDKDFNVVSVFTEAYPPAPCLTRVVQTAIHYDWVSVEGMRSPVLVPTSERISAKVLGQKQLWYTSVVWTDYREFGARHTTKIGEAMIGH